VALSASGAGYVYGAGEPWAVDAVRGVDLDLDLGGVHLIVGPTGSGKSTLLKLLSGLLEPTTGAVSVDGRDARDVSRGTVGLAFQEPESQLFADTVSEDVAFGPRNLGMSETDAHASTRTALEAVGLDVEEFGERSPFTLSGGECRRVALAGILAMQPRYLLLDEPTAGLDSAGRAAVRDTVARLRGSTGVAIVTHDAEEFLGECDQLVMLREGTVVFSGEPHEAIAEPRRFAEAGVRPPSVLEAQMLARDAGLDIGRFALDPVEAAALIARAASASARRERQ
jgi:energy-coupling factor transport system ATP-binding protein